MVIINFFFKYFVNLKILLHGTKNVTISILEQANSLKCLCDSEVLCDLKIIRLIVHTLFTHKLLDLRIRRIVL